MAALGRSPSIGFFYTLSHPEDPDTPLGHLLGVPRAADKKMLKLSAPIHDALLSSDEMIIEKWGEPGKSFVETPVALDTFSQVPFTLFCDTLFAYLKPKLLRAGVGSQETLAILTRRYYAHISSPTSRIGMILNLIKRIQYPSAKAVFRNGDYEGVMHRHLTELAEDPEFPIPYKIAHASDEALVREIQSDCLEALVSRPFVRSLPTSIMDTQAAGDLECDFIKRTFSAWKTGDPKELPDFISPALFDRPLLTGEQGTKVFDLHRREVDILGTLVDQRLRLTEEKGPCFFAINLDHVASGGDSASEPTLLTSLDERGWIIQKV